MLSKREENALSNILKNVLQIVNNLVTPSCYRLTLEFNEFIVVVHLGLKEVEYYVKKEASSNIERQ